MRKTYIVKNGCNLITTIFVGGVERTIEFKGGSTYPIFKAGSFSTADESLQVALESDFGFGHSFELFVQNVALREIEEVENKQEAIGWIDNEFGVSFPAGTSKSKIIAFAQSQGVTFPKYEK